MQKEKLIRIVKMVIVILLPVMVFGMPVWIQKKFEICNYGDALLNYGGVIISGIATTSISYFALQQTKKSSKLQEMYEIQRQQIEIFPDLFIKTTRNKDGEVLLKVENYSNNTAHNIEIYLNSNACADDKISILKGNESENISLLETEPENIEIYYSDIRGNQICREFSKSNIDYYLSKTTYEEENLKWKRNFYYHLCWFA